MRIVQPVMWVAPVYFMGVSFSVDGEAVGFAASTGTSEFLAFILLGSVVSSYVSAVLWGIGFSLKQEMEQGTLESLWLTPNSRLWRSEEHTSELQSRENLVCRLLLEKKTD